MTDDQLPIHIHADDVDLLIEDGHVLAIGGSEAVERLLDGLGLPPASTAATPVSSGVVQSLAGAATSASSVKGSGAGGQYFRFSPETMKLLKEGKLTTSANGFKQGGVRNVKGQYMGNVEWKQVSPQRLMSAQMAVAMVALQMAIKDVQAAVERVEVKVDEVRRRIAAQQFGDVMGRHLYLQRQTELLDETGRVTETDWAAIAALGPALESDLARLRAYIQRTVTEANAGGGTDDRAEAVGQLLDLEVDLDLLTVTERSLFLYESLRLQHMQQTDPGALGTALSHSRRTLAAQQEADRELIEGIRGAGEELTRVKALEIHRIFSRRQLEAGVESLNDLAARFAGSRSLDVAVIPEAEQPSASEAFDEVKQRAAMAGSFGKRTVADAAQVAKDKLRHRDDTGPDELGSGEQANALPAGEQTAPTPMDPTDSDEDSTGGEPSDIRTGRFRRRPRTDRPPPPPF